MYTEEEAYEKQCHLKFGGSYPEMDRPCIASQCMAWRWTDVTICTDDGRHIQPHYGNASKGYCGLAGKPE